MVNFPNEMQTICKENKIQHSGYSDYDITKIETLYDINIFGDFYHFMKNYGKFMSGLLDTKYFILHDSTICIKQLLDKNWFVHESLREHNLTDLIDMKPFVISEEPDAYFYFILTRKLNERTYVWTYDGFSDTFTNKKIDLLGLIKKYIKKDKFETSEGNILNINSNRG